MYVCMYVCVCVFFVHGLEGVSVFVVFEEYVCLLDVRMGLFCGSLCGELVVVCACCGCVVFVACVAGVSCWVIEVCWVFVLWCSVLRRACLCASFVF